ncbi:uncharacterized protein LOC110737611 [Chenopodium quinoa]|uniref:uncharacterized protein LOC110737611 n=1 Tax=Chenopodium quinoa TaxID=63459 RepID=UPI000B77507F|nr:uncharacterized protein LOC110737611 [Chenopodium quinoa]
MITQSKPPTYQGEPDLTILENLLREFNKLFMAVACRNESKKADEFLELKMGSMSVIEYYTKFIELSRFGKDTMATDRQKARRFERELPLSLQGRAAHLHALELKEKAEKYELEAREKRKEPMTSSRPYGNQNNFEKQKFNHHQENPLKMAQGELVTHWRQGKPKHTKIISVMKLEKYMKKGNPIYLCSVRNLEYEEPSKPEDIEVVKQFSDVFPEEIPDMPPK